MVWRERLYIYIIDVDVNVDVIRVHITLSQPCTADFFLNNNIVDVNADVNVDVKTQ